MIKIEVASAEVFTKSGIAAKSGKPYTIREQEAFAYVVDRNGNPQKYPAKIRINLNDDQAPYAVGNYQIAPESFYVDRFGGLTLGLILRAQVPLSAAKAA